MCLDNRVERLKGTLYIQLKSGDHILVKVREKFDDCKVYCNDKLWDSIDGIQVDISKTRPTCVVISFRWE